MTVTLQYVKNYFSVLDNCKIPNFNSYNYTNLHVRNMVVILLVKLMILCTNKSKHRQKIVSKFCCLNTSRKNFDIYPSPRVKKFLTDTISLMKLISLWICTMNLALITVINPGILNPGPVHFEGNNALKIHYQKVQGLIPFSCLSDQNPLLDVTKMHELQTHVNFHKPDLIILNETWLKDTIDDNEILSCEQYKIFRCDRTTETHPPDPDDPKKFRKNGGGVFIAVKTSLAINAQRVNLKIKAELLAVELVMNDSSKVIIATCYRVGTLGIGNQSEICNAIHKLLMKKKVKKFILIGDFNLPGVSWCPTVFSTNYIEKAFIDSFAENRLIQCINLPTHLRGNILDLLLTTSANFINNLTVHKNSMCKSDHYLISFSLKLKVKRRNHLKRKCFDFKRANWESIKNELSRVNWNSILDSKEPDESCYNFINSLMSIIERNIPKISVKSEFSPPWFDSEWYSKCKEKDRLRKKFKQTKNLADGIKFAKCRKYFKNLMKKKMRDNICGLEDNNVISKRFWRYVKSTSNSYRIPETLSLDSTTSSDISVQANLFNQYFYSQFSNESNYNIDMNFENDNDFSISFSSI